MKTAFQWQEELKGETSLESIKAIQADAITNCVSILTMNANRSVRGFDEVFKLLLSVTSDAPTPAENSLLQRIQLKVCQHFGIELSQLIGNRRDAFIVFPRQIGMYLSRRLTSHASSFIGNTFGGRDHGTVLHACKTVKQRMETEPKINCLVIALENELKS